MAEKSGHATLIVLILSVVAVVMLSIFTLVDLPSLHDLDAAEGVRRLPDIRQYYIALNLMKISTAVSLVWSVASLCVYYFVRENRILLGLSIYSLEINWGIIAAVSVSLQKHALLHSVDGSWAKIQSSPIVIAVADALIRQCTNGSLLSFVVCSLKYERQPIGNDFQSFWLVSLTVAGWCALITVIRVIVMFSPLSAACVYVIKLIVFPPLHVVCRLIGLAWKIFFSVMVFSCLFVRRAIRSLRVQPAASWEGSSGQISTLHGPKTPDRKVSVGLKGLGASGPKGQVKSAVTARGVQSENGGSVVELREVAVGNPKKPSVLERLLVQEDLFLELCNYIHAVEVSTLRLVSDHTRTVVGLHLEHYGEAVSRRLICTEANTSCWGCGILICTACSHELFRRNTNVVDQNSRLRPCCTSCYFGAIWSRDSDLLRTMLGWCRCAPIPRRRLVCAACNEFLLPLTAMPLADISRESWQKIEGFQRWHERRIMSKQPKARDLQECCGCKKKLWRWALKWWRCEECRLEVKFVAI